MSCECEGRGRLERMLARTEEDLADTAEELAFAHVACQQAQGERDEERGLNVWCREQIDARDAEIRGLIAERDALRARVAEAEARHLKFIEDHNFGAFETLRARLAGVEYVAGEQIRLRGLTENALKAERKRLAEVEREADGLLTKLREAERKLSDHDCGGVNLGGPCGDCCSCLDAQAHHTIEALKARLAEVEKEADGLLTKLRGVERERDEWRERAEKMGGERLGEVALELARTKVRLGGVERELAEANESGERIDARLYEREMKMAEVESQAAAMREALDRLARIYDPAHGCLATWQQAIDALEPDAGRALLDRLRLAEAVCEAAGDGMCRFLPESALDEALAAWRKAVER